MLTKAELLNALELLDDEDAIVICSNTARGIYIDEVFSATVNGGALQLTTITAAEEMGWFTSCYLCDDEIDGNETAFDPSTHRVCPLCAVKLRRMGLLGGLDLIVGKNKVAVTTEGPNPFEK